MILIDSMYELILIFTGIFISSFISTVAGLGAALIILPLFVYFLGPTSTVVALTLCMIWGNINKIYFFRHAIDKQVVFLVVVGGIPAAALGAFILPWINPALLKKFMGVIILLFILTRLFSGRILWKIKLNHFPFIGVATGLVSGLIGAAGPVNAPFFLNYGLVKEQFNGTNAATALIMHCVKILVYYQGQMITAPILTTVGVSLGAITLGTMTGKKVLTRFSPRIFEILLLCVLTVIALQFLFFA
jgi:uncharacterized membrane protein YfcA